jgi:hypothetical protein
MNEDAQPMFFPVSRLKLFVMLLVTLDYIKFLGFTKTGSYSKLQLEATSAPFCRAVSTVFLLFLNIKIKNRAKLRGIDANFSPFLLALAWFGLALCARLPKPYLLGSFFSVRVLLPVQEIVN